MARPRGGNRRARARRRAGRARRGNERHLATSSPSRSPRRPSCSTTTKGFENKPDRRALICGTSFGPSVRRIALTLEEAPDTPTVELIRRTKDKLKQRTPPREVAASEAPVYENTLTGDDIDLDLAADPASTGRSMAGAMRAPRDAVITRDPDTRLSQRRHLSHDAAGQEPHRPLSLARQGCAPAHHRARGRQGKPMEVAAAWGIDPLFMLVGSQTLSQERVGI